ncbi:MAG: PilC/PilY family type IV pilus protein [Pseudomonadota bacterium]
MKTYIQRLKSTSLTFLAALWCSSPVWADDTEIFFGDVAGSAIRPNVLFIIDTSGSMSNTVDGTGKDRLDNVKDAFNQLLDELNNVNVGLMRFTNPGGPILFPVKNVDEIIPSDTIVTVESTIDHGDDDAQELNDGSGQMFVDLERLQLAELEGSTLILEEDQVSDSDDDAEERIAEGNSWNNNGILDLDSNRRIGVRFSGLDVPPGATVTNAYLRFTGENDGNGDPLSLRISGQKRDSGGFPTNTTDGTNELGSRANTDAEVDWTITQTVVTDQTIDTPNIASILNEIISHPAWDPAGGGEDDVVFIVQSASTTGNPGERDFVAVDESTTRAPRLFVEYYVGALIPPTNSLVGLRFDTTDIPRGVTVTSARIEFTAERDFDMPIDLQIAAEESGNSQPFTSTAGNISARTLGTALPWAGTVTHAAGDEFQSPDLSSIVQSAVARSDWCGGNALSFVISGPTGAMPVFSFEGNASLAPRLRVQYEFDSIPQGTSCIKRTQSRTITASSDDVEEGQNITTGVSLDLVQSNPVGLRFTNIDVPRGATINEAYLEFTAVADDTGSTTLAISAEASANAATYTSADGSVTGRSYFSPAVNWGISEAWTTDGVYQSPDLSSLISSVVAQGGWSVGNALGIQVDTTGATDRRARTFDNSPGQAPRLVVSYEDDGSGLQFRRVRDELKDVVAELNHAGWTPIQDTLYEAARYYTDMDVLWGATRGDSDIDGGPFSYARVSAAESMVPGTFSINRPSGCSANNLDDDDCSGEEILGVGGGSARYDSPIDDFCQEQSHIILLTDGDANRPHSTDLIPGFIGGACANDPTVSGGTSTPLTDGELCVKDLARYMNDNDLRPTLNGNQRVTTHTIGFNFSSQWLEDVANAGGGAYRTADNATELVEQIRAIIGEVLKTDSTFVAPVAAVNQFNQLSHLSQVYFAVFRPDEFPRWRGNLKRYRLQGRNADIVDADGNPALDDTTGFFATGSRSFWSEFADGPSVDLGGAAENVPVNTARNVYTYLPGSSSTNLASAENAIVPTNTDLDPAAFNATDLNTTEFEDLIQWIRGRDVDDENDNGNVTEDRYIYGDPLHSRPVAITYGGDSETPDVSVYVGTNAGALHAIDAVTGQESFAFFPAATLPMQRDLRENLSTTPHPYGIDGTPTSWFRDNGRNGIDPTDEEDWVRLYTGMRRGGRNYYGLDVTDRAAPELMWQIEGGTSSAQGDFTELGQSWSQPVKTQIELDGDTEPRDVLLFTAGYDEDQDTAQLRETDNMGRGMYIVDAITGELLWSGGKTGAQTWNKEFAEMDYSFPSTVGALDINQDGLVDMWFAADTGGQLWRFDVNNGATADNLVSGGVIADLGVAGGNNEIASNRRFFVSPSVALVNGPQGPELAIAIGSGFRPSPLSTLAQNRLFMIRQQAVYGPPSSYTTILASDLYNATGNLLAENSGLTDEERIIEEDALFASQGWYIDFTDTAEKALSAPLIANDQVIVSTYIPGVVTSACTPAAGQSRAYTVDLENGSLERTPLFLLTSSIVDQANLFVGDFCEDGSCGYDDPIDLNDPPPDPQDPNDPSDACLSGSAINIKLNAESGGLAPWCNDSETTYWFRER